ncbi:MAG: transporter substrate-binding protein [Streptomyces oryziradicis]|nr:transporter substrate-binding protein [Actinacidiphila oryziradicis]
MFLRCSKFARGAPIRFAAIGLAAAVLTSCVPIQHVGVAGDHSDVYGAPVGNRQVRAGGDLVVGLSAEPDQLDPTTSSSSLTRNVMSAICEKLYDLDASGRIVPQLATQLPTISRDGLTVTIPVRTGVVFADGTPFNANAVRTSLQRDFTMKTSQRTTEMGPIKSIEATDATHVVLHYKRPFAPITAALADRAGMVMSPAALAAKGDNFGNSPVCVGPFKFVNRVPQTSITVKRDPLYYDAAHVHLDTITYRIMTDANIRAANLRSGDIQVADTISPQDVDALAKDPNLKVLQSGFLGYRGITFNTGNVDGAGTPPKTINTPIADSRVRAAFGYSVDRKTLVNTVFNNWFEPACSPIAPTTPYASAASNACPAFNPKRSLQLLKEAGVHVPLKVTLTVANSQDELRYAQALQASVAEGGFDLRIVPVEYATSLDVRKRGGFELMQIGWSGRIDPDANTSSFLATSASSNYGGFSSAQLDDLLSRAAQITDTAQRATLYGQAVQLIQRENPIVYLYRMRNITVYSTRVAGVEVYSDGLVRLGKAAFVSQQKG